MTISSTLNLIPLDGHYHVSRMIICYKDKYFKGLIYAKQTFLNTIFMSPLESFYSLLLYGEFQTLDKAWSSLGGGLTAPGSIPLQRLCREWPQPVRQGLTSSVLTADKEETEPRQAAPAKLRDN